MALGLVHILIGLCVKQMFAAENDLTVIERDTKMKSKEENKGNQLHITWQVHVSLCVRVRFFLKCKRPESGTCRKCSWSFFVTNARGV